MDLAGLDMLVLAVVGVLAAVGAMRGFVTEVLTLIAWVAAVIALKLFYQPLKATMATSFGSEVTAAAIGFVLVFFGTFFLFRLVAQRLGERTRKSVVGPIDRVLGLGFGAIKGLIAMSVAFLVFTRGYALIWGGDERLPEWLTVARTEPLLDVTSRAIIDFAEDRQKGNGLGDEGTRGEIAEIPGPDAAVDPEEGYTEQAREALDELLEDSGGTEI
jgi:membrane protein required for colicin V production